MECKKVSFFGPQYGMGGAGRVCSAVGKKLARNGFDVDFLVEGSYSKDSYLEMALPENAHVVKLTDTSCLRPRLDPRPYTELISSLTTYLAEENGGVLISNMTKFNLMSVWASAFTGFKTGLVLVEHNLLSPSITGRSRVLPWLVRTHYSFADEVVGVSSDVSNDLCKNHGVSESACTTIRNPVDVDDLIGQSAEAVNHDWFRNEIPVVVGVGRFVEQKKFSDLLEAFERLLRHTEARLVMLGDGPLREELSELAIELGIEDRVDFLGFVSNPYKYMSRAELLVMSSKREGCPVVALEALACGTPVVSTDCPGGNSDILKNGEYGELVDVGDVRGMADAMRRTLADPPDRDWLVDRARHYSVDKVTSRYIEVIDRVIK